MPRGSRAVMLPARILVGHDVRLADDHGRVPGVKGPLDRDELIPQGAVMQRPEVDDYRASGSNRVPGTEPGVALVEEPARQQEETDREEGEPEYREADP